MSKLRTYELCLRSNRDNFQLKDYDPYWYGDHDNEAVELEALLSIAILFQSTGLQVMGPAVPSSTGKNS
jgi:hypothetical protein